MAKSVRHSRISCARCDLRHQKLNANFFQTSDILLIKGAAVGHSFSHAGTPGPAAAIPCLEGKDVPRRRRTFHGQDPRVPDSWLVKAPPELPGMRGARARSYPRTRHAAWISTTPAGSKLSPRLS